jgi:hypothetical protein
LTEGTMRAYILATVILFAGSAIYVFWDAYTEVTNRTMIPEFNRIWLEFGLALSGLAVWGLVVFLRGRSNRE